MLIDMHAHYMPRALMSALGRRPTAPRLTTNDGKRMVEYGPRSGVQLTPDFYEPDLIIEHMDAARIDHAVLSVTIPGVDWFEPGEAAQVADESNSELASVATRHPDRLSALATVPLQAPELSVEVLKRAIKMGLKGAMIYSNVAGGHLDLPGRRIFFDAAAALDVPVLLHPTYPLCAPTVSVHRMIEIAGFLFDTTTAALRLVFDGLYDRHPGFKFIVPHAGSLIPYFIGRIDHFGALRPGATGDISGIASDHLRRMYVDTVCDWAPAIQDCLDFFGVDQVLLGTDYPFWPMLTATEVLDRLHLSAEHRAKIEHENASRLFGIRIPSSQA